MAKAAKSKPFPKSKSKAKAGAAKKKKAAASRMGFAYILECADSTLYIGSTTDIARRVHQHNHAKSGAHYTKIRRPVVLKYSEQCATLGAARSREAALKRLSRKEKLALFVS